MSLSHWLASATLKDLIAIDLLVQDKLKNLQLAQDAIEQYCYKMNWHFEWFIHPGIPGTVFLRVWYTTDATGTATQYYEAVGYSSDLVTAQNSAAKKALHFFRVEWLLL